jgi:Na+/phosphate symporter
MQALEERHEDLKYRLVSSIQKVEEDDTEISRLYLLVYDLEQDLLQSVRLVTDACRDYVRNSLVPFSEAQQEQLLELARTVERFLEQVARTLQTGHPDDAVRVLQEKPGLLQRIEELLNDQVRGLRQRIYGNRNTMLFFSLQLETKDIIAVAARFVKLYRRHQEAEGNEKPLLFNG